MIIYIFLFIRRFILIFLFFYACVPPSLSLLPPFFCFLRCPYFCYYFPVAAGFKVKCFIPENVHHIPDEQSALSFHTVKIQSDTHLKGQGWKATMHEWSRCKEGHCIMQNQTTFPTALLPLLLVTGVFKKNGRFLVIAGKIAGLHSGRWI